MGHTEGHLIQNCSPKQFRRMLHTQSPRAQMEGRSKRDGSGESVTGLSTDTLADVEHLVASARDRGNASDSGFFGAGAEVTLV